MTPDQHRAEAKRLGEWAAWAEANTTGDDRTRRQKRQARRAARILRRAEAKHTAAAERRG